MIRIFHPFIGLFFLLSCSGSELKNTESNHLNETGDETWSQEPYLLKSNNPQVIDLTDTLAVKMNLNGYWVNENNLNSEYILKLRFDSLHNISWWDKIKFDKTYLETGIAPMESCQPFVSVLQLNDSAYLNIIGLAKK